MQDEKLMYAILAVSLLAGVGSIDTAAAQDIGSSRERMAIGASLEMAVPLFKARVVTLDTPALRVAVGNPDVADIVVIRPSELYVLGKDIGTTNVLLWDRDDRLVGTISVEVVHDLGSLKAKFHQLLPGQAIEVHSAQRSVVLTGTVSDAVSMSAAVRLAEGYLAQVQTAKKTDQFEQQSGSHREDKSVGSVINLLQIGGAQQVMLEVKVAEVARSELKRLNVQFNAFQQGDKWSGGGVNGGATFPDVIFTDPIDGRMPVFDGSAPWGPVVDEFAPTDMAIQNQGLFASFLSGSFLFNTAIDAAKEKGLAKILAEPTLTTLTGQEAKFLSGGEFPIPVPQGTNGTVTIEFKEFGVGLKFLPVVLNSGHINLKVNVSVSELSDCSSVVVQSQSTTRSFLVPCLSSREASGTVELGDGQTMGLAGLINDSLREVVTKFPGLGSIPVLGALFRSQQYRKGETELVILVTPRLAKPLPPGGIPLPTDNFVEPSDAEFYLLGRTEGRRVKKPAVETKQ